MVRDKIEKNKKQEKSILNKKKTIKRIRTKFNIKIN
jgi:hypothetical protein